MERVLQIMLGVAGAEATTGTKATWPSLAHSQPYLWRTIRSSQFQRCHRPRSERDNCVDAVLMEIHHMSRRRTSRRP